MSDFDSIASRGSPDSPDNFCKHPVFSFWKFKKCQEKFNKPTTCNEYVKFLTRERNSRADTVLYYMDGEANTCNCYFFRKSQKCFHILSPATQDFYDRETEKYGNMVLRSMLFCDLADETSLFDTLNNLTLITQSETVMKASTVQCNMCNLVFIDLCKLNAHIKSCSQKKITSFGMVSSWRYEVKFSGVNKIVLDTNCIPMSRHDLHHLIPLVSKIYDKLETLDIRSSLLQIIAQDPLYQKVSDVLVEQKKDDVLGTYHLYLYLVKRLLPFLEEITDETIENKIIPVYTVIRTDNVDALKDIIGFDQEKEQEKRVNCYPESYRSAVEDIVKTFVVQGHLTPDNQDLLRNMIHDGLCGEDKQTWAFVLNYLDAQMCVFPIIRHHILQGLKDEVDAESDSYSFIDSFKVHHYFIYGRGTMLGDALTNIFGVIPRKRIRMSTLKDVALFPRGKYIYLNHEPWKRGIKRGAFFTEGDVAKQRKF